MKFLYIIECFLRLIPASYGSRQSSYISTIDATETWIDFLVGWITLAIIVDFIFIILWNVRHGQNVKIVNIIGIIVCIVLIVVQIILVEIRFHQLGI